MADFRPQEPRAPKPARSSARETVETVVVALLLAVGVHATVAEARYIPSESMAPTLAVGDRLIVEKITPLFGPPKRGDILVFYPPAAASATDPWPTRAGRWLGLTADTAYIKRVIGLPGETVAVRQGKVFINDKPLDEPYLREAPDYTMAPEQVPAGHLFMMGDNRNNSQDSHIWGPLPLPNVIGHAAVRFWPLTRIGTT